MFCSFRDLFPVCYLGDTDGDTGCGSCKSSVEHCQHCQLDLCNIQPGYLFKAQQEREKMDLELRGQLQAEIEEGETERNNEMIIYKERERVLVIVVWILAGTLVVTACFFVLMFKCRKLFSK